MASSVSQINFSTSRFRRVIVLLTLPSIASISSAAPQISGATASPYAPASPSQAHLQLPINKTITTSVTMSSLSNYLASKYLSADPPSSKPKKRKRTKATEGDGLIIADDDVGFGDSSKRNDEDEDGPLVANLHSAEFKKAKISAWKTVGVAAPSSSEQLRKDDALADGIVAQAAAENAQREQDDAPTVEKMADGTLAGLQSAADLSRQMAEIKAQERQRWDKEEKERKARGEKKAETVYRDATGRRIDISMRRAEARREEEERAKKEKKEQEEMGGEAQMREKERRREELEEARFMPLARTIDDEDLNRDLKNKMRWDDPAMQFLSTKEDRGGSGGTSTGGGPRKPTYQGAAAPNRYGIRPGHRWDGVDRSNGWEAERFKQINRRRRNKELDFAWQEDT